MVFRIKQCAEKLPDDREPISYFSKKLNELTGNVRAEIFHGCRLRGR